MKTKRVLGYKAFNKNLTCRGFQYKIGETYEINGELILCYNGFHFCKTINDCYNYYFRSEETRICKIEALGEIVTDNNIKFATNKIKILSEVKNPREKTNFTKTSNGYCNYGDYNNGNYNYGDYNNGNYNYGDYNDSSSNYGNYNTGGSNYGNNNTGYFNYGDYNSGDRNCGSYNTGYFNSGNYNTGDCNKGNYNAGNFNIGDFNIGNYNTGFFNTKKLTMRMFNKPSKWTYDDWITSGAHHILMNCPISNSCFIPAKYMTDKEKTEHPEYTIIGGYNKEYIFNNADRQKWWDNLYEDDKKIVKSLPNFDAKIFEKCTGIKVDEGD